MADLTVSEFDTPAEDMPKPVKEKKKVKQPEKLEGLEVSADLVDQVNAIAEQEEAKAEQMKNTVDFALYGGLVLVMFGIPAVVYKLCCMKGNAAPSGLSNVVSAQRGVHGPGAMPTTRYNTEQLRQTVARLRAQV